MAESSVATVDAEEEVDQEPVSDTEIDISDDRSHQSALHLAV